MVGCRGGVLVVAGLRGAAGGSGGSWRARAASRVRARRRPASPPARCPHAADLVITHALEWPSLTIQWLPVRARPPCRAGGRGGRAGVHPVHVRAGRAAAATAARH